MILAEALLICMCQLHRRAVLFDMYAVLDTNVGSYQSSARDAYLAVSMERVQGNFEKYVLFRFCCFARFRI
jgi:hypothetical protein